MQQNDNDIEMINEFHLNTDGYADLPDDNNPLRPGAAINKLSVLSCTSDVRTFDLHLTWLIPNLRQFCEKRREGNFPAIEKFRVPTNVDENKIFYVDFLLKPKIVADTIAMDYLQFTAQIKSLEPLNYFAHFKVSILTRLGEEMWTASSTKGAAFPDLRSFRTQLVPIRCLFTDEPPNLLIDGDLHLSIQLQVRIRVPDPFLFRTLSTILSDSSNGDLKIEARYRNFYVHRRLLARHDIFANIRELHPFEQEINLTNWNQDQLVQMLFWIYTERCLIDMDEAER